MNFETYRARSNGWHAWYRRRSMNVADLINATIKVPMADVGVAIKSGDAVKFAGAYAQPTAICNACHQSTNHIVVIKVPKASAHPDQDFGSVKPRGIHPLDSRGSDEDR
jgi:hypothetical protein